MADVPRQRLVEYYNPRPMILGLCFFWGIVMGFCLFYFAPPKQMMRSEYQPDPTPVIQSGMSERERRHLDTPNITLVEPAPEEPQTQRPRFETMDIELAPPHLSTDGGLTGRTARPLDPGRVRTRTNAITGAGTDRQGTQTMQPPEALWVRSQQPQLPASPPIPELFP